MRLSNCQLDIYYRCISLDRGPRDEATTGPSSPHLLSMAYTWKPARKDSRRQPLVYFSGETEASPYLKRSQSTLVIVIN